MCTQMPHWYYTPMLFLPSLHHLPFFQKLPCSKACRTSTKATPKERGLPNLPIAIGLASHHQSCDFGMSMDWFFRDKNEKNETLETPFLFIGKVNGFRWRLSLQPLTICSMVTKSFGDLQRGFRLVMGAPNSWMVYFMEIHGNPEKNMEDLGLAPF